MMKETNETSNLFQFITIGGANPLFIWLLALLLSNYISCRVKSDSILVFPFFSSRDEHIAIWTWDYLNVNKWNTEDI